MQTKQRRITGYDYDYEGVLLYCEVHLLHSSQWDNYTVFNNSFRCLHSLKTK